MLSGEMKILRSDTKKFEEFENADAVLSRWKKLKVLHVESETEIQRFGNFSEHKLLEKIVVWGKNSPGNRVKSEELGSWGKVTKSWFNPKQPLNSATLENVVAIEIKFELNIAVEIDHLDIQLKEMPSNLEIKQLAERMKNLEDLRISGAVFALKQAIGLISSFKNLKVLHVESETEIQRFRNFSKHKLLEKIVVEDPNSPRNRLKSEELGSWGKVTKSWFNPKQPLEPATLENIVAICIELTNIPPNFEMEQMAQRMKNLEDLQIRGDLRAEIGFISSFKNLKNVYFNFSIRLQDLIATLNYIASLNLKISGWIDVHDYGSHEQQRNIFEEAVPILNEKFPGKCESLEIDGDDMSIRFDGNIAVLEEDFYNPDVDDADLGFSASYD